MTATILVGIKRGGVRSMRSEAQKAADKRYQAKARHRYKCFIVHLLPNELEHMSDLIRRSGMSKADFLRWAVKILDGGGGEM